MQSYSKISACLGYFVLFIFWGFQYLEAELKGSPHDFSKQAWNSRSSLCGPCHTTHHVMTQPLWGRQLSRAVYTMYPEGILLGKIDNQPSFSSLLCLSCHDGTQPLESKGAGRTYINAAARRGPDLRNHHPVSVVYVAGSKLVSQSMPSGLGRSIAKDLLKNGKVECVSCHDVHSRNNNARLLHRQKDLLCQICHIQVPGK